MYYGAVKDCDIANGIGVRVSIFVSGCRNRCNGCFQPQTWDFKYGKEYTPEAEAQVLEMLKKPWIDGLTVLGGEPFEPENQPEVWGLVKRVREELPEKNIWMYTGYTYEILRNPEGAQRTEYTDRILDNLDILVDGRFEESKRNLMLKFRGSENQRLINMKKTIAAGQVVIEEI